MASVEEMQQWVRDLYPELQQYRRYFHRHPELSFHEEGTSRRICEILEENKIPFRQGVGRPTGIVAELEGSEPGPCIAFRADMDALPIKENTGLPFASENSGVMHACGHDMHITSGLGLALVFARHREIIRGKVRFIFQFAEEMPPGGAKTMIEAGCLDGADKIYGMHVDDTLGVGEIGVMAGAYMGEADWFEIRLRGKGGHGSRPDETQDPIAALAVIISNINQIVSRKTSYLDNSVISICKVASGHSCNVIPAEAEMQGTVRTFSGETAKLIEREMENITAAAAGMYGLEYEYNYHLGYPSLVNSAAEAENVRKAAERLPGYTFRQLEKTPISEDFSRYLEKIPGAFFRVGIRNPEINAVYPLHSDRFCADERGLMAAVNAFLQIYMVETGR